MRFFKKIIRPSRRKRGFEAFTHDDTQNQSADASEDDMSSECSDLSSDMFGNRADSRFQRDPQPPPTPKSIGYPSCGELKTLWDRNATESQLLRLPTELRQLICNFMIGNEPIHIGRSMAGHGEVLSDDNETKTQRKYSNERERCSVAVDYVLHCHDRIPDSGTPRPLSADLTMGLDGERTPELPDINLEAESGAKSVEESVVDCDLSHEVKSCDLVLDSSLEEHSMDWKGRLWSSPNPSLELELYAPARHRLDLSLLRTCRQLYHETRLLLYTSHTFCFAEVVTFSGFCRALLPEQIRAIRAIHLLPIFYLESDLAAWEKLKISTSKLSGLRHLDITFVHSMVCIIIPFLTAPGARAFYQNNAPGINQFQRLALERVRVTIRDREITRALNSVIYISQDEKAEFARNIEKKILSPWNEEEHQIVKKARAVTRKAKRKGIAAANDSV